METNNSKTTKFCTFGFLSFLYLQTYNGYNSSGRSAVRPRVPCVLPNQWTGNNGKISNTDKCLLKRYIWLEMTENINYRQIFWQYPPHPVIKNNSSGNIPATNPVKTGQNKEIHVSLVVYRNVNFCCTYRCILGQKKNGKNQPKLRRNSCFVTLFLWYKT